MKHFVFFFLTITILLIPNKGFSQSDFKQGYVIYSYGDTLHGLLDVRSDSRNSRIVKFKESESADQMTFYPDKTLSYHVDGESYYSKNIVEKDKDVFMHLIIGGRMSFFVYKDQNDKVHFYVEKELDFIELTNDLKEVVRLESGTKYEKIYLVNINKYYGVLKYLVNDCDYYQTNELQVDFNLKSIAKVIDRYNSCFESKSEVVSKSIERKTIFKKTIYIGLNFANMVASGYNIWFNPSDGVAGASLGFLGQVYIPSFNKKIGMDFGVFYNKKGAISNRPVSELSLHYLDFYVGFSFTYPKWKLQPLLSAGLVYGVLLNQNSDEFQEVFGDNTAPGEFGYILAFSLNLYLNEKHAISFRVSYENSLMTFNFLSYSFRNSVAGLKIGYLF